MAGTSVEAQIVIPKDSVNYGNLLTSGTDQLLYASWNGSDVYFRTTATPMDSHYEFQGVSRLIIAENDAIMLKSDGHYYFASQLFFVELEAGGWYLVNIHENRRGEMESRFFARASTGKIPEYLLNAEFFTAGLKMGQIYLRMAEGDYGSIDMILNESAEPESMKKLAFPRVVNLKKVTIPSVSL